MPFLVGAFGGDRHDHNSFRFPGSSQIYPDPHTQHQEDDAEEAELARAGFHRMPLEESGPFNRGSGEEAMSRQRAVALKMASKM